MVISTSSFELAEQAVAELQELLGSEPNLIRLADGEPDLTVIRAFAARKLREGVASPEHTLRLAELVTRLDAASRDDIARRLRVHTAQFEALQQVVRALDSGTDRLAEVVTQELCTSLGYGKAMFSVVRGSTWSPIALAVNPELSGDFHDLITAIDGREISLREAPREAELVRRRKPYAVDAVDTYRHTYRPLIDLSRPAGYLAVPVVVDARAVAMIHVDRQSDSLSDTDVHLVAVLAGACASSKERAELRRQISTRNEHVDAEIQRLTQALRHLEQPLTMPELDCDLPRAGTPNVADTAPIVPRAHTLTAREREVLTLMATGATNAAISRRLCISDGTVKSHVQRIFKKLGVSTRAEVAALCANTKTVSGG
ncbi:MULTISPECIES: LuxR C-terminal-related transcriptional regulator [unclassified Rhodococcus (in: high G+C Gram-positive bacteria)]|uniref:helix-turn-helix transcriptional regulator n=1 Tax=unclassified Rhodococcus (in: high G+C Gram-positive bacteria) TaxID=192944 RepID=UPI00163B3CD2|nr:MULTISPECIES: LuxR C-terminal-related transcriptional regulator [unclassified Rhodococcus (in: high G+C Gram-positive bacteria)]MBC2642092.1 GAF domain-containing protein [Rhodococcus sp. 3A]MBC2893165.1 GAF domain-containing protein [Rhodococcus sp. 4CII]